MTRNAQAARDPAPEEAVSGVIVQPHKPCDSSFAASGLLLNSVSPELLAIELNEEEILARDASLNETIQSEVPSGPLPAAADDELLVMAFVLKRTNVIRQNPQVGCKGHRHIEGFGVLVVR